MALLGRQASRRTSLRSPVAALAALAAAATLGPLAACQKEKAPPPAAPPPPAPAGPRVDIDSLTGRVGVKPGGLANPNVGPDAALMWSEGTVTVRRVGEDRFIESTPKMQLFAGDTVWTGPHREATVAFADDTLVQLAEETVVVVGNRAVSPDPASSVAVLYGVARISVSPRVRGEGPFLTYVGASIVAAKGTAFAVGLVVGGPVRVGVEHGEVEVAGAPALDKPLTIGTGELTLIDAQGDVGPAEPFKTDDWGAWRFSTEQKVDLAAAARTHSDRLVGEEARLDTDYLLLQKLITSASTLTWQAESNPSPKVASEYKATALERAASIEAAYRLANEIARLTHAALSDAFILGELRARHPAELGATLGEFAQEIAGAVLYDKKLRLVSDVYLGPLRSAYYAHTARGRARAASLDMPPASFASIKLTDAPPAEIAKRLPAGLYTPPRLESVTHLHPLYLRAPKVGWDERLTLQPVPARQGSWYVAPPRVEARVLAGVAAGAPHVSDFAASTPTESAKADLSFLVPPLPPVGTNSPAP